MAKVEQNKNSRIILQVVIVVVIVLILAVFIGVIVISLNGGRSSGPIKPIENQSESNQKEESEKKSDDKDKNKKKDDKDGKSDDDVDPGDVRPIKGEITSAGLSGNNISVRVRINEALEDAACKLTLTSPQKRTYSQTVNTVTEGESSTLCNGFDVSMRSMGLESGSKDRKGEWQVVVDVTYGSRAGKFTSKFTL